MAKTGPKPEPIDAKKKRRDWRGVQAMKKDAARRNGRQKPSSAIIQVPREPLPATDAEWKALLRSLPGYDPFRGAKDYEFDDGAAVDVIDFFEERLHHVKGAKARQTFNLERWQRAVLANLFGWKHKRTKLRRYREVLLFVPRKNGKTPMAAGILLYMLCEDQEAGAEVYGAASEYKQASLVFEHARGMVAMDDELRTRCKVYSGQSKAIQLGEEDGWATYRVVSSDAFSAHGWNTHAGVIDELHAQDKRDLVDALMTSTGAREQPLILYTTTSDFEREGSVCNEKHHYASQVRDGLVEDASFLPIIYEATKDAEWTDEAVWHACNPNLDVSVSLEYLRRECKRARELPSYENTFKRLHLNIRTEQATRWIPIDLWDECCGDTDPDGLEGQPCYAGLDLATTSDLTALSLVFPSDEFGGYDVLVYAWIPEETMRQRERRAKVPYGQWVREGHIRVTSGNVTDYAVVRRDINELADRYGIQEIAADRLFQGAQICTELMGDGFDLVAHGQGFVSMAAPTKAFEELVLSRKIRHGGNPLLRWHISNVSVETDAAGNMKPSRKASCEKIDAVVATIMAIGRAEAAEDPCDMEIIVA